MAAVSDELGLAEGALYRAMIACDETSLRELLADDLVYIHSDGVSETKQAYLASVADGFYEYEAIATLRAQNWNYGEAVIRTGLVNMRVGKRGQSKNNTTLLITTHWRRETSGWRLVLRHATRIPER